MRSHRPLLSAPALLLPALVLACGGERAETAEVAFEDLVPGVPRAQLAQELRIDGYAESLSVVSRVAPGSGGDVALMLRQDAQIWTYDGDGTLLARAGGPGDGPGEFRGLATIGWLGDTLWALDSSADRLTFFAADGSLVRTLTLKMPLPLEDAGRTLNAVIFSPLALLADGRMLGTGRAERLDAEGRMVGVGATFVAMVSADGTAGRVIAWPSAYEDPRWYLEVEGFGRPLPFTMRPQTAVAPDGQSFGTLFTERGAEGGGGELVLTRFSAAGDTLLRRAYPFRGVPIARSSIDSLLASMIPEAGRPTEGPTDLPQRFQALATERMPAAYDPVTDLVVGEDGTLWMGLRAVEAKGRDVLVLDASGEPLGTVLLPSGAVIQRASAATLWVTERDELGMTSVVRYRVEGLGG